MYGLIGTITIGEWGAPGWALFYKEWPYGITWDDNFNPILKEHQHVGCPNNVRVYIYSKPLVSKSAWETDTWQTHNSNRLENSFHSQLNSEVGFLNYYSFDSKVICGAGSLQPLLDWCRVTGDMQDVLKTKKLIFIFKLIDKLIK